ncbi:MAG: hypothetical protein EOM05_09455 [Clostridia bacterium]|jgi:hypothetical protein|nr:hypothetical protein [Clostridia bacterium]
MFVAVIDQNMVKELKQKGIEPFNIITNAQEEKIFLYKKFDWNKVPTNFSEGKEFYFTDKLFF